MDNTAYGYECEQAKETTCQGPLSLSVNIEDDTFAHSKAHSVWASFKILSAENDLDFAIRQHVPTDFVVVLDTGHSMKKDNKIANALASITYMMNYLTEKDRFALVHFNTSATLLFELSYMTENKKEEIHTILTNIQALGNANICDGLCTALSVIQGRSDAVLPISSILLLTDGLSNYGLAHNDMIQKLKGETLHENLTINCFGYGKDHSSSLLQEIAFLSSGGLYYYIENEDHITKKFGDCLATCFTTVAHSIRILLEAFDGCRFIKIRTKFPFRTAKTMKKYIGSLGSMSEQESRSVLMRLSLRGMKESEQRLFRVSVSYTCSQDQKQYSCDRLVTVHRKVPLGIRPVNAELQEQINRVTSVEAIDKAIVAASEKNFGTAERILRFAIQNIATSSSATQPFSQDLLKDLNDCILYVANQETFKKNGAHEAYQCSTMYNQERSVGMHDKDNRSTTYGYFTGPLIEEKIINNTESAYRNGVGAQQLTV